MQKGRMSSLGILESQRGRASEKIIEIFHKRTKKMLKIIWNFQYYDIENLEFDNRGQI